MTTQLVKNHSPPMMDTTDTIEGPKEREVQSRSSNDEPEEAEIQNQAGKPFPFLKLPAEIRNTIYGHLLAVHDDEDMPSERDLLHGQPPITRVNRQTRAETLARYYRTVTTFLIETGSSTEWVGYVKKALAAFTGGPLGLSSAQSSLRHLDFMMLDFFAEGAIEDSQAHIEVDMSTTPLMSFENIGKDPSETVAVGIPTMDWTDEAAARAACDEVATRLEEIVTKRFAQAEEQWEDEGEGEHDTAYRIPTSDPEILRAAVDAMCLFMLACPHLKNVSVYDSSVTLFWTGPGLGEGVMTEQTFAAPPPNENQPTD